MLRLENHVLTKVALLASIIIVALSQQINATATPSTGLLKKALALLDQDQDNAALVCLNTLISKEPNNARAYSERSLAYGSSGKYDKALDMGRQSLHLSSDNVSPYEFIGVYLLALQRLDDARQMILQAQSRNLDDYLLHNLTYTLAFLANDSSGMNDAQNRLEANPESQQFGLSLSADTALYAGRVRKARELTERSAQSALQTGGSENAAIWLENAAIAEAAKKLHG